MIRFCPNCETERSLGEVFCEGTVGDQPCGWDLSTVPIIAPGERPRPAPPSTPRSPARVCTHGHPVSEGDLLCPVCGADIAEPGLGESPQEAYAPEQPPEPDVVDGWRLDRRLATTSTVRERFIASRIADGRHAVLTLYAEGSEPDPSIYDVLRRLPRDHVPEIIATGRWRERAYEVREDVSGGTLADLDLAAGDIAVLRRTAEQIGRALHAFSEAGLRHRDLRPGVILVREREPLDLVISGFGSARLSDFDLDIVSPLATSREMAPETIAGGVAAASDWWSLGMVLLEQLTRGACFEGVNTEAFLIQVVTNGAPIPPDLDPALDLLLRGLLARDRRQRWQWNELRAWLAGEPVSAPATAPAEAVPAAGAAITLAGRSHRTAASLALAAAEAARWDEAREQAVRGVVAAWAEEAKLDPRIQAGIRQIAHLEVPDDLKLSLTLKVLHPAMPLIVRGDIVTPGWLLDHPDAGYDLISGPVPDFLQRLDAQAEAWLSRLKARAETVRMRARQLEIALNEEELQVHLLSTSRARLTALWEARRRLLPDTEHPGLVSLFERRQTQEEDLILLLGAAVGQFRSVAEILDDASVEAARAGITGFERAAAEGHLAKARRDIHRALDDRLNGFARCGIVRADEWADQFRLERRLPIARVLALLAIPAEAWREPAKQVYVAAILDHFAKKVAGAVLRGPLARMTIGKWTPRVDLAELGSDRRPAAAMLDRLLARGEQMLDIDPAVFVGPETLERRLRALHAHAMLYRRDTGIDGLYLGFPFLLMRDPRGNRRTRIAPVLLWPVRINPEVGNRGRITVGFDPTREEVRLNPAFEGLMGPEAARRWQEAAKDLLGRAAITAADAMDALGLLAPAAGRTLTRLPGRDATVAPDGELVCTAVLFHLAFMGQAIVEDLRHLRAVPIGGTGLETALRITEPPSAAGTPRTREADRYFTASSDPSQEAAVLDARSAPGLLIEGPPGTGKSQTIVNMVADAIGRKKSLLIVCQKQAALEVVRKRLEAEGLGNRIIMITDVNRDREPIVRAIREQLETLHARPAGGAPAWRRDRERLAARIEALEGELDRHHEALHRLDPVTGLTYRTLLGELIAIEEGRRPLALAALRPQLEHLDPAAVATLEETCAPLVRYWLPARFEASPLAALKLFDPDRGAADALAAAFTSFTAAERARAQTEADTVGALEIDDPEPCRAWIGRHIATFRSLDDQAWARLARCLPLFRAGSAAENRGTAALIGFDDVMRALGGLDARAYDAALSPIAARLSHEALADVVALGARATAPASWLGRLNPARLLRQRRWTAVLGAHGIAPGRDQAFLAAARLEQDIRPQRHRLRELLASITGAFDRSLELPPGQLAALAMEGRDALGDVYVLVRSIDEYPFPADLDAVARAGRPAALEAFLDRAEGAFRRAAARKASQQALDRLAPWLDPGWLAEHAAVIARGAGDAETLAAITAALPTLVPYQTFRIRASRLGETELAIFRALRLEASALEALPADDRDTEVRRILAREARLAWKARLELVEPALLYDAAEIESRIKALAKADREMRRLNRELLIHGVDRDAVRPPREWEDITRLRGQRARRLREFIDRGSDLGLMTLRPVWLMNPDVASRVLQPKAGMFDTVIYDEASQMPVEHALPSLFRGRVLVVSGDEKQMPPTAFFSSKVESDEAALFDGEEIEDAATEEEREALSDTWNRREIKDCPDLLQLARTVLPATTLQIHYRSVYRELIGFSNASFYGNRLSVPARHPDDEVRRARPIELVRADGTYADQTNPTEAGKVIEILADLWSGATPPSVGIVTFNRKQADVIEEFLEDRAEEDPAFRQALMRERDRMEAGEDMGFFVKNVENVQGDERDVIIFSSTFGRNGQGTFRRHFGVLGQTGGERRLNVAVTRARAKIVMVTSMPIAEISDLLSTRRAPAIPRDYLQAYLEYARAMSSGEFDSGRALLSRLNGERAPQAASGSADHDGFCEAVEGFLRERGWDPVPSEDGGAFALDFAIADPRTGQYGIGIECDGPRHRILDAARAREVWRPEVLRRAIPHLHRVSSRAWLQDGNEERRKLQSAVERALAQTEAGP